MPVRAHWTVFCCKCGDWRGEVTDKAEAIRLARRDGFVRMVGLDGVMDWFCAPCASRERAARSREP